MKKKVLTDVFVKVCPLGGLSWLRRRSPGEELKIKQDAARSIMAEIKRHVDDVESMEIVEEFNECVCEFCGAEWTEKSDNYNGGCCDKDEENAPKEGKDK